MATTGFLRAPLRWHGGHLLVAALSALALVLAVRLVVNLATPAPVPAVPMPVPPADPALLSQLDPFGAPSTSDALPVTALELSLHGIRLDGATGRGSAIIATPDGVQKSYAVGESVGGALLVRIAADHVVLDSGGRQEALYLDSGGEAAAADAGAAPDAEAGPPEPPRIIESPATETPAAPPASAPVDNAPSDGPAESPTE